MWVFMSEAFLSIVADRDHPKLLRVRARRRGDIEKVFPAAKVRFRPNNDYRFMAMVPREVVGKAMFQYASNISYGNFKNSIADRPLHDACARIWSIMWELQNRLLPKRGGRQRALPLTLVDDPLDDWHGPGDEPEPAEPCNAVGRHLCRDPECDEAGCCRHEEAHSAAQRRLRVECAECSADVAKADAVRVGDHHYCPACVDAARGVA